MTSITASPAPVLLSAPLPVDDDTQRGRKRRRSSASNHLTSHGSMIGTLRGRARFRTPSPSSLGFSLSQVNTPDGLKERTRIVEEGMKDNGKQSGKMLGVENSVPGSNPDQKLASNPRSMKSGKGEAEDPREQTQSQSQNRSQSQGQSRDQISEIQVGSESYDEDENYEKANLGIDLNRRRRQRTRPRTRNRSHSLKT
ncbi:hypothetical protein VTL71DRAFT_7214 [Oculimacula yallundae]|uniref:Uncharacterized protein n=1 Tax=Oculimacula yallundae TaxID=86028 RepID=A0ABR4BX78_9HELO